jgi:SAM-dependent methyltransferase
MVCREAGDDITSLRDLATASVDLALYSASASGYLHHFLAGRPDCEFSDYIDDVEPGERISEHATCQDLQRLTFPDASFELVVTEDVFEHVRDDQQGFREVARVLRSGGKHIFTIPMFLDRPMLTRVDTSGEEDVHLLEPEYHGDPVRGLILAYRTYGIDLFSRLAELGFHTELHDSSFELSRFGIFNSFVLVSTKAD